MQVVEQAFAAEWNGGSEAFMKRFLKHSRAGFTMMEMIVVIAIIGVLAAIAVPSVLGFIEYGKQTSRSNVARTLYLAAQNRLTELRITRKLESEITGEYFTINADGNYIENKTALETIKNVYNIVTMPAEEQDKNRNYVHYISKAKGAPDPNDPVIKLLDPVIIDKTVLYDAILIEFNVKTGVVLSVFYSDAIADGEWLDYYDNGSLRDIVGGRPYDPAIADERKQGYYGVDQTGNLQDFDVTLINVYDSYTRPLPDAPDDKNTLYAEIHIPANQVGEYDLLIETSTKTSTVKADVDLSNVEIETDIRKYDGYGNPDYMCFIWTLDHVGGVTGNHSDSIVRLKDYVTDAFTGTENIHVGISGTAASATSFTEAHPYYLTQPNKEYNGDKYSIMSARHLYNIRYMSNATFTQKADIDLLEHNVLNFKPIPTFTGKYNGTGYLLKNLNVNIPDGNAGLFGEISGGTVEGLTLDNPSISSDSGNVGSVAGTVSGTVKGTTLDNPNIRSNGGNAGAVAGALTSGNVEGTYVRFAASAASITGIANVGGIVGSIESGGTLADTTFISDSSICNISGGSSTGGIAGSNSGTLTRALFLALAPTNSEDKICPIVGTGTGSNAYYLRGTSKRPKMPAADPDDEPVGIPYNMEEPANDIGTPCDTAELYNKFWESGSAVLNTSWEIMDGLDSDTADTVITSEDNRIYPYPIYKFSKSQAAQHPNWPIVTGGDIVIDNVYYYEKYSDGTCGAWSVNGGIDTLKDANDASDTRAITEAGYMVIMDEDPTADTPIHFFVKNITDTSWYRITDRNNDPNPGLVFEADSPLAVAAGRNPSEAWAAILDLSDLIVEAKQDKPLQMMYSTDEDGINNLNLLEIYIQPLFAKGLYDSAAGSTTHSIRTPWQMRNISSLTNDPVYGNTTSGNTFIQDLDLDFNTVTLNNSAVADNFQGIYRSSSTDNRVIKNVNILLTSVSNVGLFEQNSGTIENINLDNASILNVSGSGSNFGFIAGINNGNIRSITMTSSNIIIGADNTGSVAGTNTGTITNVKLQNSGINGANNVGGIAGTNSGTINTVNLQNANVAGTNGVGSVAGTNGVVTAGVVTGSIDNVTANNIVINSTNNNAGGVAGSNAGVITTVNLQDASVEGTNNVGGIAGTNAGTINNVNLQDPNVTGANDIGGVAGTNGATGGITGATVSYANMTRTISGTGSNVGGIAGNNTGVITTVNLQDASVEGCNYIGGVAGTNGNGGRITGANVIFTNENREIKGVVANSAGIGGIAGQNSDRITDSVFISTTAKVHISGIDYVGGIAGTNSANINQVLFLARAPLNAAGNTIYPIIGNGTAATNSFYLYGVAVRPNTDTTGNNFNFNVETVSGGGTPLTTLQMHQMDISGWTGTNWNRNPIDNANVNVPIGNVGYPYPMSNNRWVDNWPITHIPPIAMANIVYYEIYTNDTYGMWSLARDRLSTNQIVRDAGYAVLSQGNMLGTHSFFAENPATGNWQLINTLNFSNTSQLANAARTLGFQTGTDAVYAAQLDLNALAGVMAGSNNPNNPLRIMHTLSNALNTPTNPVIIQGYLHPLFAKGLYNNPTVPNVTAFSVRTAWQMRNISALAGRSLTAGRTFTQELDLDFGRTGAGVGGAVETTVTTLSDSAVTGNFAGTYNGGNRNIDNLTINATANTNGVGLFADNGGIVRNLTLRNANVRGDNNVGSVTGNNNGTLTSITVQHTAQNIAITGVNNVGGISGTNSGTVTNMNVQGVAISGNSNVGGIAGTNTNSVALSGVQQSTVTGSATSDANVGGVIGNNSGTVADVYFVSTADITAQPVSNNGGGIVGSNNNGTVDRALYLAPAPMATISNVPTIFPIARTGADEGITNSFYLAGSRYSIDNGRNYINNSYNHGLNADGKEIDNRGGGIGVISKFIDLEWLNIRYDAIFEGWDQTKTSYPYPIIANMTLPTGWPVTDSPARPDQADRTDWEEIKSTSNRAIDLGFVNGNFTGAIGNYAEFVDANTGGRRIYIHMNNVTGWSTRPVNNSNPGDRNNLQNNNFWIELQEPLYSSTQNSTYVNQYMYTNYEGYKNTSLDILKSPFRYAELNADVQGTLYQLCKTTPGAQFYYSFYHATRRSTNSLTDKTVETDKMSFYLTGVNDDALYADDSKLVLIRPCWSPRLPAKRNGDSNTGAITDYNPAAKYSVNYGNAHNLSYYKDKFSDWSSDYPHLYDVWVRDLGYGITFWSSSPVDGLPSAGENSSTTITSTNAIYANAKNHIIGYWGESFGWKHYYGLYTVPAGQTRTEFAYQSNTAKPQNGNYLDGISFKAPSFLSIDKSAKIKDKKEEIDVKFVQPGDIVTIELNIKSWGEVAAGNIVIEDQLAPYDAYIEYVGNLSVNGVKNPNYASFDKDKKQTLIITIPTTTMKSGDTLTVRFDVRIRSEVVNAKDEKVDSLLYYFKNQAIVKYRETEFDAYTSNDKSDEARVTKRNGSNIVQVFIDPVKLTKTVNSVGKAVGSSNDTLVGTEFKINMSIFDNLDAKGTFRTTDGFITDIIPRGFSISDYGNLPKNSSNKNRDGTTTITIRNVNLGGMNDKDELISKLDYYYTIEYTGDGYGVSYVHVASDYKYQYISGLETEPLDVLLEFPQPVVGIKVVTSNDKFGVDGAGQNGNGHLLDILKNDNFSNDYINDIRRFYDNGYDVIPYVRLCDSNGNLIEKTDGNGNYIIEDTLYDAMLVKGVNNIRFTPKQGARGDYVFYYKIVLDATKEGGTPPEFDLSSRVTKVTVSVTGMGDSLAYYEKYDNGTVGYHYGYSSGNTIDETGDLQIEESGYGVVSTTNGTTNLKALDTPPATQISLTLAAAVYSGNTLGYYHPNFAKAVYSDNTTPAYFSIRTPEQMMNIGELDDTDGITFTQERDLDFGYKSTMTSVIVSGEFMGTYDGGARVDEDGERVIGKTIKNVKIENIATNTGLFSQNSGTIKGVTLQGSQDNEINIIGTDNVGGIAGWNNGVIENCVVEGDKDGYGVHIEGVTNVGGIVGLNDGKINNCTVKNTSSTIIGDDFVGGIAGKNDGTITYALVDNVKIEGVSNVGVIAGNSNDGFGTHGSVEIQQVAAIFQVEIEELLEEEPPEEEEEEAEDDDEEPDEDLEQVEEEAPTQEEEVYEITVDGDELIDVEVTVDGEDATQAAEGDPVTVTVYPTSDMGFDIQVAVDEQFGIVEIIDEITDDNIFEFIMPNSPVKIYIIPTLPQEGAAGEGTDVDESGNSNGSGEESGNEESNADNNNDEENGNNSEAVIDGNNSGDGGDIVNNEQMPENGEANDPNQDGIMQFLPLDTMAMAGFPIFALRRRRKLSFLKRGGRDAKTKTRNKG